MMKRKIIRSLTVRASDEITIRSSIKFLRDLNFEEHFDTIASIVYLYTRPKRGAQKASIYLTEIISALGHALRGKLRLKKDSSAAAKVGGFILYTFEELKLIEVTLGAGDRGHGQFVVQVVDDDAISKLWNQIEITKIEKLPSETPYEPWTSSRHALGNTIVKTGNRDVLRKINPETHPMLFDCINKAQQVGWIINKEIYDLHLWALRNKTEAFAEIWELQNPEAKTTKLREAKAIGDIAKRYIGKTFYHSYYFDFRGRKYPTTAYLHEQGSDLARGLLLRADSKAIGESGFFWLMVSIASNWAGSSGRDDGAKTDKIPLQERYAWCLDNEEILLSYAENPKVNQGWMKADKPWQFLAACFELMKLRIWQGEQNDFENFKYSSHLECYIDGLEAVIKSCEFGGYPRKDNTEPNLRPQAFIGVTTIPKGSTLKRVEAQDTQRKLFEEIV
jgi:hypothetical protein